MIRVVHPGSRILMLTFSHPGARIQGSKRHPIPDPGSGSATLVFSSFNSVSTLSPPHPPLLFSPQIFFPHCFARQNFHVFYNLPYRCPSRLHWEIPVEDPCHKYGIVISQNKTSLMLRMFRHFRRDQLLIFRVTLSGFARFRLLCGQMFLLSSFRR
jgi:hypothetical protein